MKDGRREFAVNRGWVCFYIAISGGTSVIIALIFMISCYEVFLHGKFMAVFTILMTGAMFVILAAFAENLVRIILTGGPALVISEQGVCYRIASEDNVPWLKIRKAGLVLKGRMLEGVSIKLSQDFAKSMHWRGLIANSYKSDTVNVRFRFIDAPKAEIAEALLRKSTVDRFLAN